MQLAVYGKNIEVTDALREYAEKKLGKLERFVDEPMTAQANMYVERGRHVFEVTVNINGLLLRGEESASNMYASIDLVADKLEKQVMKYKTRFLKNRTKESGGVAHEEPEAGAAAEPTEPQGKVVKVKRFPIKPLTLDEAIVQMELLSHDFFVFANAETERINVLYRRKDGNYGLLDPEW
ncbi:MAG TPA: ribosome-associated translation inhibitor RaiA [Symbiobacteriaceae bacterium]